MALFRRKKKEEGGKEAAPAAAAKPLAVVEEKKGVVGAELIPIEQKPKSDVWTLLLIFSFIFFCSAIYIAGKELHEQYGWTAMGILGPYKPEGEAVATGEGGAATPEQPPAKSPSAPPAGDSKK